MKCGVGLSSVSISDRDVAPFDGAQRSFSQPPTINNTTSKPRMRRVCATKAVMPVEENLDRRREGFSPRMPLENRVGALPDRLPNLATERRTQGFGDLACRREP